MLHLAVVEKQSGCLDDLLRIGADVNMLALGYELSWWKLGIAHSCKVLTAAQCLLVKQEHLCLCMMLC